VSDRAITIGLAAVWIAALAWVGFFIFLTAKLGIENTIGIGPVTVMAIYAAVCLTKNRP
jgi:hypothetical protein